MALFALVLWGCSANHPPSLAPIANQSVTVGQALALPLGAHDPDGDALTFTIIGLPDAARIDRDGPVDSLGAPTAILRWSPTVLDSDDGGRIWSAAIQASDGQGGGASKGFAIQVLPAYGIPEFLLPGGVALDPSINNAMRLRVRVKDDDSVQTALTLDDAPEGATLTQDGGKTAWFYWQPTDEQLLAGVHRAVLRADDGDHAAVTHSLLLVLLGPTSQSGCAGADPQIAHHPPIDHEVGADAPFWTAEAHDEDSKIQEVWVEYFTPSAPSMKTIIPMVEAEPGPEAQWGVALPDALVKGGPTLVHYQIIATDNDDVTGVQCDREARSPKVGYWTMAVGAEPGSCVDDGAEPDGTASDGAGINPPQLAAGLHYGRRLCGLDLDRARVSAAPGSIVTVALSRPPNHAPVSLRLRRPDGVVLAEIGSGAANLTLSATALDSDLWLEVEGQAPGGRTSYNLAISITATACPPDVYEPNDSVERTSPWPAEGVVARICPGDRDFYAVVPKPGSVLKAILDFDGGVGDLDLSLVDSNTGAVLTQSSGTSAPEILDWDVSPADTSPLALMVLGASGASNAYTLALEWQEADDKCAEDLYAPQQTSSSALVIPQGLYEGFTACPDAPDWFRVDANGGETLIVAIEASNADNPPSVDLFETPGGPSIGTADHDGMIQWRTLESAPAGPIWVRVRSTNEPGIMTGADYIYLQDMTDAEGPCTPDRLEPNDSDAEAALIFPGVTTWLRLCGDERDTLSFNAPPYASVQVSTFHSGQGYTDLTLIPPSGIPGGTALDLGGGADIEGVDPEGGLWRVRIDGDAVEGALGYDLWLGVD